MFIVAMLIIVVIISIFLLHHRSDQVPIINESNGAGIGRARNIADIPFQASLTNGTEHFCGAVLLSQHWALTSAHCLRSIQDFKVRIKSSFRNHGGELIDVLSKHIHPLYIVPKIKHDYDVALLKLKKFNKKGISKFGQLPTCENLNPCGPGDTIEISGWGVNNITDPIKRTQLQSTVLSLTKQSKCEDKLAMHLDVTDRMICAGHKKGGKDACQGDSGGPAVCKNFVIGLITVGVGCAKPQTPAVYTNLSNHEIQSWIHETTKNIFQCPMKQNKS